jgi:heat-inducible transcriptional repressor
MAELAADGYLQQPHTSAGRVPTEKAFDVFVQGMQSRRLQPDEVGRIRDRLDEARSVEERVERCSHMLTEMTQGLGITAAIPTVSQTLDRIELVSLGDRRVLMIVMTSDKLLRDTVVTLDTPRCATTSISTSPAGLSRTSRRNCAAASPKPPPPTTRFSRS